MLVIIFNLYLFFLIRKKLSIAKNFHKKAVTLEGIKLSKFFIFLNLFRLFIFLLPENPVVTK